MSFFSNLAFSFILEMKKNKSGILLPNLRADGERERRDYDRHGRLWEKALALVPLVLRLLLLVVLLLDLSLSLSPCTLSKQTHSLLPVPICYSREHEHTFPVHDSHRAHMCVCVSTTTTYFPAEADVRSVQFSKAPRFIHQVGPLCLQIR